VRVPLVYLTLRKYEWIVTPRTRQIGFQLFLSRPYPRCVMFLGDTDTLVAKQSPVFLTCVTTGKPREYRTPELAITLRSISEHLFWGFIEKQSRYAKYRIAEAEKALLDWVYLTLQSGLTPHLDEIELRSLDKQKLVKYASKYPGTVRNALTNSLAFEHFAA
jgi:hypothetical protein